MFSPLLNSKKSKLLSIGDRKTKETHVTLHFTVVMISLLLLLLAYLCQLSSVCAVVKFESNKCNVHHGNYNERSVYHQNLNHLLLNLSSKKSTTKFYNSTRGEFPSKVYGLYQCRQDLSQETCNECIQEATRKITQVCPLCSEAIVWYDECMLRYANRSFFSLCETSPSYSFSWDVSVSNYEKFAPVFASTMKRIFSQAASTSAPGRFVRANANWTSIDDLSSLAQCSQDIDEVDCKSCLAIALAKIRKNYNASMGVMIFYPSCQLSYVTSQRLRPAPLDPVPENPKRSSHKVAVFSVLIVVGVLLLLFGACICLYRRKHTKQPQAGLEDIDEGESFQFDFQTIKDATGNFSVHNKLGRGGFGGVYKGKLRNGQDIAVKRLSMNSRQGNAEFKAEILLTARLKHKNLVKFEGFCLHGKEKLLVYELLPNSSIDKVLFGENRPRSLDWKTRYKILLGTARGLLYLHEDSRLKIIHRDLKPSNILLDENMNPKIADFGLARLFEKNQFEDDTNTIAGTYGYMAPEYALTGRFSIMSDVYSFGVIALEIVSGHMCNSTAFPYDQESLCQRAWNLWRDDAIFDLVDTKLSGEFSKEEVASCIHIGLLCIQRDPNKRPNMGMIVSTLNGRHHLVALSKPEPPMRGPSTSTQRGFH